MSFKLWVIIAVLFCSASTFARDSSDLVVLIPGAGSSGDEISLPNPVPFSTYFNGKKYFDGYMPLMKELEVETLVCPTQFHGDHASLPQRILWCREKLMKENVCQNYSSVRFIGHSMGGVVAQRIYESAEFPCISSVLAISTPFYGSDLADFVVAEEETDSVYGRLLRLFKYTSGSHAYIADLTRQKMRLASYGDDQNLYSIANFESTKRVTILTPTRKILAGKMKEEDPTRSLKNDGVVPTDSMRLGTVLGQIDANHFETGCFSIFKHAKGCSRTLKLVEKWLKLGQ